MKVLFLDPLGSYGARTCSDEPLGGTQSAVTYLAFALARAGVAVIVANRRSHDVVDEGVAWRSLAEMQQNFAATLHEEGVTHLVVVSSAGLSSLRPRISWDGPWVLWNHHWVDQPSLAPLRDAGVRDGWDAVVSLSAFHHAGMRREFQLRDERHWILRNALGPHFGHLFAHWDEFRAAREHRATMRFVYTSTPFRGLDVVAAAWPRVSARARVACTVVSGMQLYGGGDGDFESLFATVASTPGMRRVQPVGQSALAGLIAEHDFWGYPCTFVETSCISALEAVAAGLYPVTTALGALPETLEGWGAFVSPEPAGLVERWSEAAVAEVQRRQADPVAWLRASWARREHLLRTCSWDVRAREWIGALDLLRRAA